MRSDLTFRVPPGDEEGDRLWVTPTQNTKQQGSWGRSPAAHVGVSQYNSPAVRTLLFKYREHLCKLCKPSAFTEQFHKRLAFKLVFTFGMTCRIRVKDPR